MGRALNATRALEPCELKLQQVQKTLALHRTANGRAAIARAAPLIRLLSIRPTPGAATVSRPYWRLMRLCEAFPWRS